jgi:hypothetical protein
VCDHWLHAGKGDRETSFGALHLAQANGDELKYLGKLERDSTIIQ